VEEAYAAGIKHMIFVTGRNKRAIEDHFDIAYELETELTLSNKHELLAAVRSVQPDDMLCSYVRQPRSLGLGHAVLCAEHLVGDEPFAVLLADDLMIGEPPVLAQLNAHFAELQCSMIAVQEVPLEDTDKYGIVRGQPFAPGLLRIEQIVEKPAPALAPSRLGVAGRYIFTPQIFAKIREQVGGVGGEIQLTDGVAALLQDQAVYACTYAGARYDCGSKGGFLRATVELALNHPEVGPGFAAYLQNRG
jgi:UTP--glucose-1-phosphate uridylyltransferase